MTTEMVLIDVDGTMVDSVPDLAWCIDQMQIKLGNQPYGESVIRNWVGNGVDKLVHRALMNDMELEADLEIFEPASAIFKQLYAKDYSTRSKVYDGVFEALDWFKEKNYKLGCVTNKAEQFTLPILKDLGLDKYFEIVVSGDTLPTKKPDPAPLLHVANFFNIKPENSLMIGDSISDVKAARNANFRVAALTGGYNHGLDIRESNPDIVIDSMAELIKILS